jgi:hypothetical protein
MRQIVRSCVWVVLLALSLPQAVPAQGPVTYGRVLLKVGKWLAEELLGYGVGKGIDKALGLEHEAQLQQVEANLLRELRRGAGDTQRLQNELTAAQTQLKMVSVLLRSQPTTSQLESFRRQLASDLDRVLAAQRQHDGRIGKLETESHRMAQELEQLREEVRQLSELLRRSEERAEARRGREVISPRPEEAPRPWRGQREVSRPEAATGGVRLQLEVSCSTSEIFLDEVTGSRQADTGSQAVHRRGHHRFGILEGTGAVVLITGDHNRIHVPVHLRGRVRILDRGTGNRLVE